MRKTHIPAWSKAFIVAAVLGTYESVMDWMGHPLPPTYDQRLLAFGVMIVVIWTLGDMHSTLREILEEMRKK